MKRMFSVEEAIQDLEVRQESLFHHLLFLEDHVALIEKTYCHLQWEGQWLGIQSLALQTEKSFLR